MRHFGGHSFDFLPDIALDSRPMEGSERLFYFIYVEDRTDFSCDTVVDAPRGELLPKFHPVLKESFTRFRTSGISVRDYLDHADAFEPLNGLAQSEDQRAARRDTLAGLFERSPIPVIDLFVPLSDDELALARATLVPASWHLLVLRSGAGEARDWPVFRDDNDPRFFAEPVEPAVVESVLRVSASDEYRLRDIFSLNHIADADIEEDEGGSGLSAEGPPPPPDDDDDGEALRVLRFDVDEEVDRQRGRDEDGDSRDVVVAQQ